jgi:hypothetical protein
MYAAVASRTPRVQARIDYVTVSGGSTISRVRSIGAEATSISDQTSPPQRPEASSSVASACPTADYSPNRLPIDRSARSSCD